MKYAVKNVLYDVNDPNEPFVFFVGKDHLLQRNTYFLEGWKARRFAEAYIAREMKGYDVKQITENVSIENKKWVNVYEVIELQD